jgi:hypothetical protein
MGRKLLSIVSVVVVSCAVIFGISLKRINLQNKVKAPPRPIQEQSPYKKYGYNIDIGLLNYKKALKDVRTKKVKIYCIGESNTRGEYSSDEVNKSWVGIMKTSMQKKYGNSGEGFINIYEGALPPGTKGRWRLGDRWIVSGALNTVLTDVGGFGGCFGTSDKSMEPAILTFTGTNLEILYAKARDGGTASVTIDGKKVGTISCVGEEVSFTNKVSYSGLSNETHTLVIRPNSTSSIFIEGAIASSKATGIEVDKIAISSKMASYFNSPLQKKCWDTLPAPDLVLISFGINDAANHISVEAYKANMIGLVIYWQERGSSVCIVPNQKPSEAWIKSWTPYVKAQYEIANTYKTGIIDIYKAFYEDYNTAQKLGLFGMAVNDYSGNSGSNLAHPSDKGYKYIGDIIYSNIQ